MTVTKGLAINPAGEIIGLPNQDVKVALSKSLKVVDFSEPDFYNCAGPPGNQHLPNGAGVYILVMSPTAGFKERAPKSGLGDNGVVKGCGSRYVQEGVQFRLVEFDPLSMNSYSNETRDMLTDELLNKVTPVQRADEANVSKLKNVLAHVFFGTEQKMLMRAQGLSMATMSPVKKQITAFDYLFEQELIRECDICLAVLYWTMEGVIFLDNWSVRRIVANNEGYGVNVPGNIIFDRDESVAVYMQFQNHIYDLMKKSPAPHLIQAQDYFYFLPPAGILPLISAGYVGYAVNDFFHGMIKHEPVYVEESQLGCLFDLSFKYPVKYVKDDVLIWLYYGQENNRLNESGELPQQRFVVFTTGHMPYFASPRYDLSRWSYSNYISGLLGPEGL
ncbi:MAG: hypothetical protein OEY07_06110 [Gammaproteobacteria bacterium]|nr:hypothetical protein [Gammaproteobacteria bacterium]